MLRFDALYYPHPSQRHTVYAANGMVATSQPLAAQAGLDVLKRGGNAVDAALATAATLTVVEPTSNGIGGDCFALVWQQGQLYGLNASGSAPKGISIDQVRDCGFEEMPCYGWIPVTVPGIPAGWAALSERFGNLPLSEVVMPAVEYADAGYPLSPALGFHWQAAYKVYREHLRGREYQPWFDTFAPKGRCPQIGETWRSPDHARTLQRIGDTNAADFYHGELARKIADFARRYGGFLDEADLAGFVPQWVDPVSVCYRGFDVWELPPNGQGIIVLMALRILSQLQDDPDNAVLEYHRQIEALKLAFSDGRAFVTDPQAMDISVADLLAPAYAAERAKRITDKALTPLPGKPAGGGTVYLATADRDGNMVSYIQSNYLGFGSGLVVPGTGIALQNRGHTFSLDPGTPNCLAPGKRTYHTIIPGFLTKGTEAIGPFGVMGGFMQPQGHLQILINTIDQALNPQAALDAPRWQWIGDTTVEVESTFPRHIAAALARMGHDIQVPLLSSGFGRGQIIWRSPDGVLAGGTEPRTDGAVAAW